MTVEDVLQWAIPDPSLCRERADLLRAEHPGYTDEQLAWVAVKATRRWAVLAGAASGAVANPLIMAPASMAEVGYVLREEGKLAGVIAAIMDPDSLREIDTFHGDILSVLFPGAVSQLLQQLGVRGGQVGTKTLIRNVLSKGLIRQLLRLAARFLKIRITQKAIASKMLPVIGGGIGAAWNWNEVQSVGRRAIRYHRRRRV
ncbi:MAG: hypothetical protein ACK47B_16185 [Armatimonadota bacterium]